jgi:hypothetical protein
MRASQAPTVRRSATARTRADDRLRDPIRIRGSTAEPTLVLDRYRLQRRLGAGGFGTVWQAHDERLDRLVAVKVVPRERVNPGRFEREAKAAARLGHPNVVTLYEAGADDDGAYLVSELVKGATLDDLQSQGALSDRDIVTIGIALCDALAHAHEQDVVHRDVKPSNILIPKNRPDGAKLTDFGVARVLGGDTLTRTGDVVGTAGYMAPEQAAGRDAGAPADLYALALVLYEALTGLNPVSTATAAQRARRLGAHLPPLRRQRRDLPRELGRGLDLALRPKPRERGTIAELRAALVASLPETDSKTGIVTGPWRPQRTADPDADEPLFAAPSADQPDPEPRPAWPERGVGAATAAGLMLWLATNPLAPAPIAPVALALIAAIAVLVAPRIGWLGLLALTAGIAAGQDHIALALIATLTGALPITLLPRSAVMWPLPAAAPALAAIGLAGAWPALAARASSSYRRAALGALGYVYVAIIGDSVRLPGRVPAATWISSPYDALHHLLLPILTTGALLPALVWAVAAVLLPRIATSGHAALDVASTLTWAVLTVSLTGALAQSSTPPPMVLGLLAGAAVTVAPTALAAYHAASDASPNVS